MEGRSLKIYTKFVWDARIRFFGRSWVILEDCLLTSTGTFEYSQYFKLTWSSSDSDFLVKIWIHNSKRYFKNSLWWPFLEKIRPSLRYDLDFGYIGNPPSTECLDKTWTLTLEIYQAGLFQGFLGSIGLGQARRDEIAKSLFSDLPAPISIKIATMFYSSMLHTKMEDK